MEIIGKLFVTVTIVEILTAKILKKISMFYGIKYSRKSICYFLINNIFISDVSPALNIGYMSL